MDNRTSDGDICVDLRLNFTLVTYLMAFHGMDRDCFESYRWLKIRLTR